MLLLNHNNGEPKSTEPELLSPSDGDTFGAGKSHRLSAEIDSTCSTPYVSAPSSPGRGHSGYFFSAPGSPMHFVLSTASSSSSSKPSDFFSTVSGSFEFEFSAKFSPNGSAGNEPMSSADELFLNGQIRPMKLSSHLQRPQILTPLLDLEVEYEDEESDSRKDSECGNREDSVTRGRDLRSCNRSLHRKARSMSPLRSAQFQWHDERVIDRDEASLEVSENKQAGASSMETPPSGSASSSRSSSSGRNSKKWIFLKDLLYRSKSEGRGNNKEKFWSSISFSPGKEKKLASPSLTLSSSEKEKNRKETERQKRNERVPAKKSSAGKPANGVMKRSVPPSAHELHYTANRAQAEEMKKKTFLPYRQGPLGCLGFSSKGYGAIHGLSKTLNPVPRGKDD
ncbi:stress response NST1-like protein [Actinidia rufa]|uniref:Stress response NST1-like protein n=1 Tax=Actinidia rufa TaxID=165716 RepID=A0A7J0FL72_9ERIC|nr:stress response NST1-like protein [Actinidia rufa]